MPLKNVTFRAEEGLINRARERAAANQTTLNEEFRKWLEMYVERPDTSDAFSTLMERLTYVHPDHSFHRDEMSER